MAISSRDTEASIAELLARMLRDETIWSIGEKPPDDPEQRERLAAQALDLYDDTAPLFADRVRLSWAPLDTAIYVLRMMIGDRCAILSYEWDPMKLRHYTNIPTRSDVERWIGQGQVQEWAAAQGHPFDLTADDREELLPFRRIWRARTNKGQLAKDFCMFDRQYEAIQERRKEWPVWVTRWPKLQEVAAVFLAAARNSLYVFGKAEDPGAYAVATATELLGQGIFVVTHAPRDVVDFFPTRPYLRKWLQATNGYAWLTRHAPELPDWLG